MQIMRFFTNPRKPMILALARPDPKKNLTTLVKAFGECRPLRELANLVQLVTFNCITLQLCKAAVFDLARGSHTFYFADLDNGKPR